MDASYAINRWYVADASEAAVVVLDTTGTEVRRIGRRGSGPGEFRVPIAVAVLNNHLYVADMGNHRVVELDTNGRQVLTFDGPKQCPEGTISQMRATRDGMMLVRRCPLEHGAVALQVEVSAGRAMQATTVVDTLPSDQAGARPIPFPLFDASEEQLLIGDGQEGCIRVFQRRTYKLVTRFCLSELRPVPVPDSLLRQLRARNSGRLAVASTLPRAIAARFFGDRIALLVPLDPFHTKWISVPPSVTRSADSVIQISKPRDGKTFFSEMTLLVLRETDAGFVAQSTRWFH